MALFDYLPAKLFCFRGLGRGKKAIEQNTYIQTIRETAHAHHSLTRHDTHKSTETEQDSVGPAKKKEHPFRSLKGRKESKNKERKAFCFLRSCSVQLGLCCWDGRGVYRYRYTYMVCMYACMQGGRNNKQILKGENITFSVHPVRSWHFQQTVLLEGKFGGEERERKAQ